MASASPVAEVDGCAGVVVLAGLAPGAAGAGLELCCAPDCAGAEPEGLDCRFLQPNRASDAVRAAIAV